MKIEVVTLFPEMISIEIDSMKSRADKTMATMILEYVNEKATRKQDEETVLIERRIAEALDRRLKATVESERQARQLLQRHEGAIEARSSELSELERRVNEAQQVLTELHSLSEQSQEQRDAVYNRLSKLTTGPAPAKNGKES